MSETPNMDIFRLTRWRIASGITSFINLGAGVTQGARLSLGHPTLQEGSLLAGTVAPVVADYFVKTKFVNTYLKEGDVGIRVDSADSINSVGAYMFQRPRIIGKKLGHKLEEAILLQKYRTSKPLLAHGAGMAIGYVGTETLKVLGLIGN